MGAGKIGVGEMVPIRLNLHTMYYITITMLEFRKIQIPYLKLDENITPILKISGFCFGKGPRRLRTK